MLITKETDYALRILSGLEPGELTTVAELCKRELVPDPFAYKILKKLERGGLVTIIRGKHGGCRLACDLSTTTLFKLLTVIDEDMAISACMNQEYECLRRKRNGVCPIHNRLSVIQRQLIDELKKHTLSDLISGTKEVCA